MSDENRIINALQDATGRARQAQQAINALGFGPPVGPDGTPSR